MRSSLVVGSLALASLVLRVHAQDAPPTSDDPPASDDPLPSDPAVREALRTLDAESAEDDPLGAGDVASLRDVPAPTPRVAPPEILRIPAEVGEEVSAIPGIRETAHLVQVRFVEGLALVDHDVTLTSRASHLAEARLRLPRPEGAWLVSVELCADAGCVRGEPDASTRYDAALVAEAYGPPAGAPDASAPALAPAAATPSRPSDPGATSTDRSTRSRPSPIHFAADAHVDVRGPAFSVHVAPLRPGGSLRVRLRYAAHPSIRGGVARLRIPARGNDLRAVSAEVRFDAGEALAPALQGAPATGPVDVEPWSPIELSARLPSGALRTRAHRFSCGARRCVSAGLDAGSRLGEPEHVTLLLDVSPSTFGPARGRLAPTLTALLSALPPRSDVRALAFAARAEPLVSTPTPATELPFTALASATTLDLGGATRLDVALRAAGPTEHAIVLGDGGLTEGPHLEAALAEAQARGTRLSVISLTGRAPHPALARAVARLGGRVLVLDDDAFAPRAEGELDGHAATLFAPRLGVATLGATTLGELLAGEALHFAGPTRATELRLGRLRVRARPAPDELAEALAALGRALADEPTRLAHVASGADVASIPQVASRARATSGPRTTPNPTTPTTLASTDATRPSDDCDALTRAGPTPQSRLDPWMLADTRSCALPAAPPPTTSDLGRGIPAETVLSMLRRRVVPVARGCFRRDRAGREDYATRAVFELRLADREVSSADVHGEIADELRECLLQSVDGLDVPAYAGTIVVRYPLYTQAHGPSVQIELHPDVAEAVDRALPPEAEEPQSSR